MDLSKLPKLSDTRSQTPEGSAEPAATAPESQPLKIQPVQPPYSGPMGLAETWISVGVGAFLLLFYPRFLQWASSRLFHTHFDEFTNTDTGAVVPYQTLPEFWSDLGPTLLAIVLIVDGLLLFSRRPGLILVALFLTAISTAFNLVWVVVSYSKYGLAPISMLAVIFGGFILTTQWGSYQRLRPARQMQ